MYTTLQALYTIEYTALHSAKLGRIFSFFTKFVHMDCREQTADYIIYLATSTRPTALQRVDQSTVRIGWMHRHWRPRFNTKNSNHEQTRKKGRPCCTLCLYIYSQVYTVQFTVCTDLSLDGKVFDWDKKNSFKT